ncbi:hypothetical protein JOE21_000927 [Desmospora profundinema]|uniref:Uncharacterized protein n=1 Tax=Desmospora profundinema TaxID=1571184 RepID=A0ABU1IJJ6_9BACL|nr:hypothetical protein [Desmospora profundinema]
MKEGGRIKIGQNNGSFNIRTQFTFVTDDPTLHRILSGIAFTRTNITGYFQTKISNRFNLVKFVVGPPDFERPRDLRIVRSILRFLGVRFQEEKVIQFRRIIPGTPGVINTLFGALWFRVRVKAIYLGEDTRLFLNVSDVNRAIHILRQRNIV